MPPTVTKKVVGVFVRFFVRHRFDHATPALAYYTESGAQQRGPTLFYEEASAWTVWHITG
jgi:hypothetical protein